MRPLSRPRKSWTFPPIPNYFDPLNFYKYVTKCRLVEGSEALNELENNYYKSLVLPTNGFEVFLKYFNKFIFLWKWGNLFFTLPFLIFLH